MELTVTTRAILVFNIEYFESSEGGMDSGTFNEKPIQTLPEAVEALRMARLSQPGKDWIITIAVTFSVKS